MGRPYPADGETSIEMTAHHLAMVLYPWSSDARTRIRRRVQELLRCTEEPADALLSGSPPGTPGALEQEPTMTPTPRSTGGDDHVHYFAPTPEGSRLYCTMCAETAPLPGAMITRR